jgi:UDP-3-O-[3-hydroxymyristoyl] glucosamine N-acyltransferase
MLLSEIAATLGLALQGEDVDITGVNTLADASPSELSFLANPKYAPQLATTKAGAVIVSPDQAQTGKPCLVSASPYLDFARSVQLFAKAQGCFTGTSEMAFVHATAKVDPTADVAPFVFIGRGAVIGPRVRLFSGTCIGEDCVVDEDCVIYPNCSLMAGGAMTKFPQIGRVVIEDDVEIGANTTIDRAALGETRVGQGTKIDNLVQLGHNVRVGRNCILVAQVGIAGSTSLGDGVILAGQVGVAGHIHLGDGCRIGAKSGVGQDVPPKHDLSGIPAMPHGTFLRTSAIMPKLPEMKRRIARLEKELAALREEIANKG